MIPNLTPDQFEVIKIMFIFLAGLLTAAATAQASITRPIIDAWIQFLLPPPPLKKHRMEMDADLDHIEQALALANS